MSTMDTSKLSDMTPRTRRKRCLTLEAERKRERNMKKQREAASRRENNKRGAAAQQENQSAAANVRVNKTTQARKYISNDFKDDVATKRRKVNAEHRQQIQEMQQSLDDLQSEVSTLQAEVESLTSQRNMKINENSELSTKLGRIQEDFAQAEETIQKLTTQNETLIKSKALVDSELSTANTEISQLNDKVATQAAMLEKYELEALAQNKLLRDAHNTIQELKGNIRVFARLRPFLPQEEATSKFSIPDNDPEQRCLAVTGKDKQTVDGRSAEGNEYHFKFDRVFRPSDSQEAVFDEVKHLVQSALDGYKVCIFAYGQTGSGKTFTMEGGDGAEMGLIPRSFAQVFRTIQDKEQKGWGFELMASYLEIYNDSIRDLVVSEQPDESLSSATSGSPTASGDYKIIHQANGDTKVTNLNEVVITSPEALQSLLRDAKQLRSVAATKCNEASSRSHSVFRLKIKGVHSQTKEVLSGMLNLVDLAGSERLANSQVKNVQLKETQAINKSLSNLGDVIFALANKSKHVPYRNSKLTYLLQNSLGGNSKTLMFVNLSPVAATVGESLNSLRFAQKVNACEIGTASRNTVHGSAIKARKPK